MNRDGDWKSDKVLVKELLTYIDTSIADWYNKKVESGMSTDELMRVVNEAVYQYYMANRNG